MHQSLQISKILSSDVVTIINEAISKLEQPRWVNRTNLPRMRAVNGSACRYEFCGHGQMPTELKDLLKSYAPNFEGFPLQEIAVNRYNVGDFIGQHRDTSIYRKNLVIALQEQGDGLYIDDDDFFIEDRVGQGVLINGIGPIHSVPPVKSLRHCLIYLYG